MGLFGRKKEKFVDLRNNIPARLNKPENTKSSSNDNVDMGFLNSMASSSNSGSSQSASDYVSWGNDEPQREARREENEDNNSAKRQKLARRLLNMTDKIEDLSNQIYHLNLRIELLEKKLKIRED